MRIRVSLVSLLVAVVAVALAFTARAGDDRPGARSRDEATWNDLVRTVTAVAVQRAQVESWQLRAEMARTEAWAAYAIGKASQAAMDAEATERGAASFWAGGEGRVAELIRSDVSYWHVVGVEPAREAATRAFWLSSPNERAVAWWNAAEETRLRSVDGAQKTRDGIQARARADFLAGK